VARRRGAGRPATPRKTIGVLWLRFNGLFSAKKERKIILSIKNFGKTSPARGGFEYLQKTTAQWLTFTYDSSMADIHIQRLDYRYPHTMARCPKTTYNDY
jgi:hypothetical protein